MSNHVITTLSDADRPEIEKHLLSLTSEDRYLRFFTILSDDAVRGYVRRTLNLVEGRGFGIFDNDSLVAFAHVSRIETIGNRVEAELGISVSESHRGQGLASKLVERALVYCRSNRINTLYMSCLRENRAMQHVARKAGMPVFINADEAFAELALDDPSSWASNFMRESGYQHISMFDKLYRYQRQAVDTIVSLSFPSKSS